jgi:hypothetical protein
MVGRGAVAAGGRGVQAEYRDVIPSRGLRAQEATGLVSEKKQVFLRPACRDGIGYVEFVNLPIR